MNTEPTTIWQPTDGQSEISQTTNPNIDTEAGLDLITEAGVNLVIEDLTITGVPGTVWTEDDSQ